ncbi:MAG: type II toxin-antitoxin system VapC family toxin [Candidatus Marinimicrobia bacterium]|nr:type II toxin-antitoxin system VapC family toxin [Candidatus Neomarinimicrobiota bacterium]
MKYLLDTCVISELAKSNPEKNVIKWISDVPEESLYLSVFTIGEIRKGIEKLPESQRKDKLEEWITNDLLNRFENRIIDFTVEISQMWGKIQGQAELNGKIISLIDGFIASSAVSDEMVIVTRNVKDFKQSGVSLLNPWE